MYKNRSQGNDIWKEKRPGMTPGLSYFKNLRFHYVLCLLSFRAGGDVKLNRLTFS